MHGQNHIKKVRLYLALKMENALQPWNMKLVEISVFTFALYCKSDDTSYDGLLQ